MRRAALAFGLVALAGVLALALLGARERRSLAFTLGVAPSAVAAPLQPGQQACQQPVLVQAAFDAVELRLRTGGGPLSVVVLPAGGGAPLGRGTLPAGARPLVAVGHVGAGRRVAICVRNDGAREADLLGGPDGAARGSTARIDGARTGNDLTLVLRTARRRSTLAELPAMLGRAALFRGGWSGAWVYWLLLAAVLLGVPALLVRALSASGRPTADGAGTPPAPPEPAAVPRSGGRARA
jgi:hypothetical protein